ncbi:modulator of FtsH protease [Tumebacillus sp. BK434]|uniref:Bax inhibitor-1/YccA family protein n=1 Tax=Tumebacillus sp. BK434 TaxID=2512169 RepID=UPI0010497DA9|nr:Bax inhibitor-1/YccA family protein [Tumebacillus sp. BK434]TCP53870.1 modulator of FtsH protease [Tumebacillus sp. BK434]
MNPSYSGSRTVGINRVLPMFFLSLLFALIGTIVGTQVPTALFLPLAIVEIGMLIVAMFMRKRRVGYTFLYLFTFISGITLYPVLAHYTMGIGGNMVMAAFGVSTLAYGATALYAWKSKADFSFLGGFLMVGLIALIGLSLWNMFFPLGGTMYLGFTLLGIFIFIGFTLYDISNIARHGVPEEMVPMAVLNLYLNFINLFLFVLRLFGINLGSDD